MIAATARADELTGDPVAPGFRAPLAGPFPAAETEPDGLKYPLQIVSAAGLQ